MVLCPRSSVLLSVAGLATTTTFSFEFPKIPKIPNPKNLINKFGGGGGGSGADTSPEALEPEVSDVVLQTKAQLLQSVSGTNNGKSVSLEQQAEILALVSILETQAPAPETVLTDDANLIDGPWYLQYTSPSEAGDDDVFPNAWKPNNPTEGASRIDTEWKGRRAGSVEAAGLTVDTSNRVVLQMFDVAAGRVQNLVDLGWCRVQVEGDFRPSDTVPRRAVVGFDVAKLFLPKSDVCLLDLSWLFNNVFPLFRGGSRDNGWIETTYIDDEMRIARGNLGTMFVITRDVNAVLP